MSIFDDIWGFLGEYGDDIVSAGSTVWDIYNQVGARDTAGDAIRPGGITDPFGDQRPYYKDRLRSLYENPSQVTNTPGYQFAMEQGSKAIERGAAKSGHFHSPNRLQKLATFNQQLATQTFNQERDALMKMAGAGIDPDAESHDALLTSKTTAGAGAGGSGKSLAEQVLGFFSDDSVTDAIDGADGEGVVDKLKEQIFGAEDTSQYAGTDLEAAASLGPDALERAQGMEDLGPNADLGGASMASLFEGKQMISDSLASSRTSDIAGETFGNMNSNFGEMNKGASMGSAAGGVLGAYALTKATGAEGNAAVATNALGGIAGGTIGAGLGSMAAGGAFGAGAGATGGAAAAGGGFAIPLALAIMAYGGIKEGKALEKYKGEVWKRAFDPSRFDPNDRKTGADHGLGDTGDGRNNYIRWKAPDGSSYYVASNHYQAQDKGSYMSGYTLYDDDLERVGEWNIMPGGHSKQSPLGRFLDKSVVDERTGYDTLQRAQLSESGLPSNMVSKETGTFTIGDTHYDQQGSQISGDALRIRQGKKPMNMSRAIENGWTPNQGSWADQQARNERELH